MVKYQKIIIYLLNLLLLLFVMNFNVSKTFIESLQVYSIAFYIGLIHLPICVYTLYQDVFKINYYILSRYASIDTYILSRYFIILKRCILTTLGTVGLPIILCAIYFKENFKIDVVMQIFVRYVVISVFVCLISFVLLCLVPFLQRKTQYIVLTSLSILPLISAIKESLGRDILIKYYFDLGVDFQWYTSNVIETIFVSNLPALLYSLMSSVGLLIFLSNRIEFFMYEKNN